MKHFTLLVLTFLFVSVLTFGQTTLTKTPDSVNPDWQLLNENSFSIQYPRDWDLDKSGENGMSFLLLSKKTTPMDNFRDNVSLLIQDLKGQNTNLDRFVEISVGQLKSMITNLNIIENKRMSANGEAFQKLIYSFEQGIYKFTSEQFCYLKNEKAYVLSFLCENDQLEKYKETGEQIMKSFKLKDNIEKEKVAQTTVPDGKAIQNKLITKYGAYWGNLIYKKEYTPGMTKEMILEFSSEKIYKISKVLRNGHTIEIWEFDSQKMALETLKESGEDGAKALMVLGFMENFGLNINSQFPNLEFTDGKLTGVYQN